MSSGIEGLFARTEEYPNPAAQARLAALVGLDELIDRLVTDAIVLATDLPAPVLAELLDLHISTAVRWVTYVKRDWTDYLAARAAEMTAAH